MNILKKVIDFVIYSSANPENISLTLKGLIPFLVLFNIGDVSLFSGIIDTVVHFVVLTSTWITGAVTTYGAVRKFYTLVKAK